MTRIALLSMCFLALANGQNRSRGVLYDRNQLERYNPIGVPPSNYNGPKGSIGGTVVDSVSGAPIRKAQVRIGNFPNNVAVTDASGSFLFDQLPPGSYFVTAFQQSYPPAQRAVAPKSTSLGPGEQKRGLEVKLTPGVEVAGRVTDEDGDPIPNCNAALYNRLGLNLQMASNAVTNALGAYLISNAPAGKYYLEIRCQAPVLQPRPYAPPDALLPGNQLGYTAQFYPGALDLKSAQKMVLTAGQVLRGVDFRMEPQIVYNVSVRVTGVEATPGRLQVSLMPDDGSAPRPNSFRGNTVQPRTGVAQIQSVPPGKYFLQVASFGPERAVLAKLPVQVGESAREFAVQVSPPAPLSGTLHLETPANPITPTPPPAPSVPRPGEPPVPSAQATRIYLAQVDDQGQQTQAEVKPDGSFTFRGVAPGRYRANISSGGFVQSVTVGGESFEGAEFELKQGAAGPLVINAGFGTGTISGDIDSSESTKAGTILIMAVSGVGNIANQTLPNQPQHYSFTLPPGRHRLYAFEAAENSNFYPLVVSEALASRAETVDIRTGSETVRNLKLITAADIEKAEQ